MENGLNEESDWNGFQQSLEVYGYDTGLFTEMRLMTVRRLRIVFKATKCNFN